MFLLKVATTFQKAKVKYAIAGGYAVSLHGAVRGTLDVDIVVAFTEENLQKACSALATLGLTSTIPVDAHSVFQFRDEYIAEKNLIAWRFINHSRPSEIVDIIITHDLKDLTSIQVLAQTKKIPILSIESLIQMKSEAKREQDLADIEALKKLL